MLPISKAITLLAQTATFCNEWCSEQPRASPPLGPVRAGSKRDLCRLARATWIGDRNEGIRGDKREDR